MPEELARALELTDEYGRRIPTSRIDLRVSGPSTVLAEIALEYETAGVPALIRPAPTAGAPQAHRAPLG